MNLEEKLRTDLRRFSAELSQAEAAERDAHERVARLEDFVAYLRNTLESGEPGVRAIEMEIGRGLRLRHSPTPATSSPSAMIREILAEAGGPMHTRMIAQRAIAMGYGGPEADRKKAALNLSSILSKSAKRPAETGIKRLGRGMFTLTQKQTPDDKVSA